MSLYEEKIIRCTRCGRFVSYKDLDDGRAVVHVTPDNEFGPEEHEVLCAQCAAGYAATEGE